MKRIGQALCVTGGILAVIFGVIGIILPVLPTTPFLLLAAFLFLKSSKRLYDWLTKNRYLGIYIKGYMEYRGITLISKIVSISLLWVVMVTTIIFVIDIIQVRLLLTGIAIAVTIHLLLVNTLSKEDLAELKKSFK